VSAPKTFTINVNTTPTVNIAASSTTICTGQTSTLTASGATNYSWSPSTTLSSSSGSVVVANPTATTIYTITGISSTCSSVKTITLYVDVCTGIAANNSADNFISIYPNPSSGIFIVSASTDNLELVVLNTLGQIVKTETIKNASQTTIDMSKMSKGVYYLQAKISDSTRVFKLILE
jgi:hypothetical protein